MLTGDGKDIHQSVDVLGSGSNEKALLHSCIQSGGHHTWFWWDFVDWPARDPFSHSYSHCWWGLDFSGPQTRPRNRVCSAFFFSPLCACAEGPGSWESYSKPVGAGNQVAAFSLGNSRLWIIHQMLWLSKLTYTESSLLLEKGLMHRPAWHLSTNCLSLEFNLFRYLTPVL